MIRVLLVEDDPWLAELESATLTNEGFVVQVVGHGYAAIDAINTDVPDVIVLDVLLAGATAFSLMNELQSYGDTAGVPIILCTNVAEQFDASKLSAYGVVRMLDKTTMHPDDLVVAVRAALHAKEDKV